MKNELPCIKNGISSHNNASLKFKKTLIMLPIGRIKGDIIWWY